MARWHRDSKVSRLCETQKMVLPARLNSRILSKHLAWNAWLYRPRFLGPCFAFPSCGGLEGKHGLVSLPRGLEVEPFDQPLLVVALAKFLEYFG